LIHYNVLKEGEETMDEELLKGNFKVKNPIRLEDRKEKLSVREELRSKAMASLGGSMVYMERTDLTWDGDNKEKAN